MRELDLREVAKGKPLHDGPTQRVLDLVTLPYALALFVQFRNPIRVLEQDRQFFRRIRDVRAEWQRHLQDLPTCD